MKHIALILSVLIGFQVSHAAQNEEDIVVWGPGPCSQYRVGKLWNEAIAHKNKIASKWGFQKFWSKEEEKALTAFNEVIATCPDNVEAANARLEMAEMYLKSNDEKHGISDARDLFIEFVMNPADIFQNHPKLEYAMYMWGMTHYKQTVSYHRDQDSTIAAILRLNDFRLTFTKSDKLKEVNEIIEKLIERIAKSEYYVGDINYTYKAYQGAFCRFKLSLLIDADGEFSKDAKEMIAKSLNKIKLSDEEASAKCFAKEIINLEIATPFDGIVALGRLNLPRSRPGKNPSW